MDYNTYETISFEKSDGIATLTIDRPEVLNALNSDVIRELTDVFIRISIDEEVRAVILTGAGPKAFVAGADISEMVNYSAADGVRFASNGQGLLNIIESCPKPVIAAVNGFALGGGMEIAMACDFIYASEKAKFGQPEINLGINPGFGGTQRLPRIVGKSMAKELVLTGKIIDAAEAMRIGLVNKVFEPDALMDQAKKTAAKMASKGSIALRLCKECVDQGLNVDLQSGLVIERNAFGILCATEDKKEGMSAFLEKRTPNFSGK